MTLSPRALINLLIFSFATIGIHSYAVADSPPSPTPHSLPNKATSDKNNYNLLTLKNGLRVILVSDPEAERFAASMAINVGSYQDPKNQQGLAHFLEHMLLLGTKKFPTPGEYQSYISNHGGTYNAYTSINSTNFFFDIQKNNYEGAIDRFSQFFISPLLSSSSAQREKNAVNAEYKAKLTSERRRLNQAFKTLLNPDHPQSKFTVGSLSTLKDRPHNPLHQQLLKLYKQNYVASNMALVLVANLPYIQLEALAEKYFSAIPSGEIKKRPPAPPLLKTGMPQLQFTRPNINSNMLSFCYQIDSQNKNFRTRPARYLSYLLGNESKGSLYASLKDKGLINSLDSSLSPDYEKNALFCTRIRLTDKGNQQINDVAQAFFATIDTIKSTPINPTYLDEDLILSKLTYDYHNYIEPQALAKLLSSRMLSIPLKDTLSSFRIEKSASEEVITHILNELNSKNLLVQLSTQQKLPTSWAKDPLKWQTEPWYQSQYSNNKFSQSFLNIVHLSAKSTLVTLPRKNPFIPKTLILIDEQDATPHVIYQKKDFVFWHKADTSFKKPTGINFLAIRFKNAANTAKHTALNYLWTRTFNDSISDSTYEPYIAGLGYSLYPHLNGITINTTGYSGKQGDYLVWLVDQLFLFRPDQEDFERIKSQLQKDLDNQKSRQAYQGANMALNSLITKNNFTTKELEKALQHLSLNDLQNFIKEAKSSFDVIAYSTGNLSKSSTIQLAKTLHARFTGRLADQIPRPVETKHLVPQEKIEYRFPSISKDSTILYSLIDTDPQTAKKTEYEATLQMSYFSILCNILNSRFYNQLRTIQQLGYIVAVEDLSTRNTPILGFLIQSPNKDSTTIIKAIEKFIHTQAILLQSLPQEDFQNAKNNLLHNLKNKARNLGDNAYDEWHEIAKHQQDFDHKKQAIQVVTGMTQKGFIQYIKQKIEEGNTAKILIHNKALDKNVLLKGKWEKAQPEGNNLMLEKP